jgi:hypothetical protein
MPGRLTLFPLACLAVVACSPAKNSTSAVQRDSAGVAITESTRPQWSADEAWRVDSVPRLDLAAAGSGANYQFYHVRDAARLPDGRIAVANAGTNQVRLYAPDGRFLLAVGRQGRGPGEYERLTSVQAYRGDSIVAFDYWQKRITVLDSSGALGRVASLVEQNGSLGSLDAFGNGRFLLRTDAIEALGESRGRIRLQAPLLLLAPDGAVRDTVAIVPGFEDFVYEQGDARPPFQHDTYIAVHDSLVFVATGNDFEFRVLSRDGVVRRIVRLPDYDLSVPESVRDSLKRGMLGENLPPSVRPMAEALANSIPTRRPAYSDLLVDAVGDVWVEAYIPPVSRFAEPSTEPRHWLVFDPAGTWLGTVDLPASFDLYEAGEDYLLGCSTDSMGVETVRMLRLVRG